MAKSLSCTQKYNVTVNMLTLDNFKWYCYRLLPTFVPISRRGLTDHALPPERHQYPDFQ